MTERAQDVADAFVTHLKRIAKHSNSADKQALVGAACLGARACFAD